MNRNEVISKAVDECIKELYSYAVPHIEWEDFIKENKNYKEGPKPYEFYYLPRKITEDICNNYIYSYNLDEQKNLLDIIQILKNYCEDPITEKYVDGEKNGYRSYIRPENLKNELRKYFSENFDLTFSEDSYEDIQNIFFKFLDMAGKFFNWNSTLNKFSFNVYLGASPSSNKEAVIENWKKYRNKDIEIIEDKINEAYYS